MDKLTLTALILGLLVTPLTASALTEKELIKHEITERLKYEVEKGRTPNQDNVNLYYSLLRQVAEDTSVTKADADGIKALLPADEAFNTATSGELVGGVKEESNAASVAAGFFIMVALVAGLYWKYK